MSLLSLVDATSAVEGGLRSPHDLRRPNWRRVRDDAACCGQEWVLGWTHEELLYSQIDKHDKVAKRVAEAHFSVENFRSRAKSLEKCQQLAVRDNEPALTRTCDVLSSLKPNGAWWRFNIHRLSAGCVQQTFRKATDMINIALRSLALALALAAAAAMAQPKMDDPMKGMDMAKKPAAGARMTHTAIGTVTKVDAKAGVATLAHEPVKSMNWPAMTMAFKVKDKMLFGKLADGRKVEFEFVAEGKDYVLTSVK